jgi:hypothetical protein
MAAAYLAAALRLAVTRFDLVTARRLIAAGADPLDFDKHNVGGMSAMSLAATLWTVPNLIQFVAAVSQHNNARQRQEEEEEEESEEEEEEEESEVEVEEEESENEESEDEGVEENEEEDEDDEQMSEEEEDSEDEEESEDEHSDSSSDDVIVAREVKRRAIAPSAAAPTPKRVRVFYLG